MLPDTPQRKNRHRGKLIATALFALVLLVMRLLGLDYDFTYRLLAIEPSPSTLVVSTLALLAAFVANAYSCLLYTSRCV